MILQAGSKPDRPGFTPLEKSFLTGFTLIELAFTAILIVILILISTATFRRTLSNLSLKDTAFTISNLIAYAQEKAIIERQNFKLKLNFEKRTYRLMEAASPEDKEIRGRFGRAFTLPRGISFQSARNEIIFYPDGTANKADIYVYNMMKDRYKIAVKGFARNRVEVTEEVALGE